MAGIARNSNAADDGAGKRVTTVPEMSKLGYLVPQFPGQTHIFFWREILKLQDAGVTPVLFSTTPPPAGLVAHAWSAEAMERTEYLASRSIPPRRYGVTARAAGSGVMC